LSTQPIEYAGMMDMGREGHVVIAPNRGIIYDLDPRTGTIVPVGARAPQHSGNGIGVNPYQQVAMVVPGLLPTTPPNVHRLDLVTGAFDPTPVASLPGGTPTDVKAVVERPVEFFGRGCASNAGTVLRADVTGF